MKILYIHSTQIDSAKANLIQVFSMCNAFKYNSVTIDLALPEPNSFIEDVNAYVKLKFGIELKFNIIFYKKFSRNRIIEKYFGIRSVEEIIKKSNADFVFTRLPKYISLILKHNGQLIFESHNNKLHNKYPIIDKYWKKKILKEVKRDNFKLFISISENLTNFWTKTGIPKDKQQSLHDGFAKDLFKNVKDKQTSRIKLNIPNTEKVVMYIGSLYPDREIENILISAKATPTLKYYIIGGPNEYSDLYKRKATEMGLNNVVFPGYVAHSEVPNYLLAADYLLGLWSRKVPTINYCSPLKVFEYMASGNVVIVHDFPTIREVLTDNEDALFVNPDDKEHLSEILNKAQNINTEILSRNSKRLVYENYTWEKRAKLIVDRLNSFRNE